MGVKVAVTTLDGVVTTFFCDENVSVIEAAAAAGKGLPSLCGQGACGSCVADKTSGDVRLGTFNPEAIGPMDGENAVLLCRCYPTTDASFDLPYTSERIVDGTPPVRQATVAAVDKVAHDVVRLALQLVPDDVSGSAAEFDPGQCMQIHVPGTDAKRAYSLANVGNWDGELEFYIRLVPGGVASTWLSSAAAMGDEVTVTGPQGAFALRENGMRPRWFVAGGTGLAPALSMMRRMAEWGDPQPVRLFMGCTTEHDLFGTEQVADVLAQLPGAQVTTCVWHPDPQAAEVLSGMVAEGRPGIGHLFTGTPAEAVAEALGGLGLSRAEDAKPCGETPDVYVCGPPAMVHAVEYALAEAGAEPDHVYVERFTEN